MENVRDSSLSKNEKEEDSHIKKFELLYLEAMNRKRKQELVSNMLPDEECTFKPKLVSK